MTEQEAGQLQAWREENAWLLDRVDRLTKEIARLRAERDNWRESFHNMTIMAKSQLDDLEELERKNTALAQRLAEAGEWEDVPFGEYPDADEEMPTTIILKDNLDGHVYLGLDDLMDRVCASLPNDWRIQRRPQAQDSTTAQE